MASSAQRPDDTATRVEADAFLKNTWDVWQVVEPGTGRPEIQA